ncbi:hypothetical protein HK099_005929 [Clydaea vesicula]|uniref:D-aminoacyl-tRNA deacylase n=1 Tax=Clydaea vesicula TaxID=447962 RepID=A0AAD5TYI3_9FUNG|nr:hypothetical protein HK099_005929 [Clydaea vesicula]
MRVVLQRVTESSVKVNEKIVGAINKGICALVGICNDDTEVDQDYIVNKLISLRLWDFEGKSWNKSVVEKQYEILLVSQFTLYAKTTKGSKPDFHNAMKSERSQEFFNTFVDKLKVKYDPSKIQEGEFGAMMEVSIVNDGPVTIVLDSKEKK